MSILAAIQVVVILLVVENVHEVSRWRVVLLDGRLDMLLDVLLERRLLSGLVCVLFSVGLLVVSRVVIEL